MGQHHARPGSRRCARHPRPGRRRRGSRWRRGVSPGDTFRAGVLRHPVRCALVEAQGRRRGEAPLRQARPAQAWRAENERGRERPARRGEGLARGAGRHALPGEPGARPPHHALQQGRLHALQGAPAQRQPLRGHRALPGVQAATQGRGARAGQDRAAARA